MIFLPTGLKSISSRAAIECELYQVISTYFKRIFLVRKQCRRKYGRPKSIWHRLFEFDTGFSKVGVKLHFRDFTYSKCDMMLIPLPQSKINVFRDSTPELRPSNDDCPCQWPTFVIEMSKTRCEIAISSESRITTKTQNRVILLEGVIIRNQIRNISDF